MNAESRLEAVGRIRETGLLPEKVSEAKGFRISEALTSPVRISDRALGIAASQFSALLKAGIPLGRAVGLISEQTSDRAMRRILKACAADVEGGMTLAQSLEKNGRGVPRAFIETVRAGETSGALDTCFCRLKDHCENSHRVKQKVISALIYPIFLMVLAAAVVGLITVWLVPTVTAVYENTGAELPGITRALIAVTGFLSEYFPAALLGAAALAVIFRIYVSTPSGGLFKAKAALKLPIAGKIILYNSAARFADTFSVLMMSGLTAVRALAVSADAVDNRAIGRSLSSAVFDLEAGKPLSEIIRANPYLPGLLAEMAAVGEESGLLGEAMYSAGEYYYAEANAASERALVLLEPVLTVVMGAVSAFIIIAVYLPMFSMYNGII